MPDWTKCFDSVSDYKIKIPRTCFEGMRVPGIIYAGPELLDDLKSDDAPQQVANVATLPGIVEYSLAMPDIHYGYGFPIGGVAAMSVEEGVISPGGVGFDINCGVRLLASAIEAGDARAKADELATKLFRDVPTGVGSTSDIRLRGGDMDKVLQRGAAWAARNGMGWDEDLEYCESGGALEDADPGEVGRRARERGANQLGTLGAGNHFIEVQEVEEIFDDRAARAFGLEKGMAAVMIHSGSRGLGHQVCDDAIRTMREAVVRYGYELPDRQLACAPVESPEGRAYYAGMCAAANFAWANRQCLAHTVRGTMERVFGASAERLGLRLVYDVAHNIAKFEEHEVGGKKRRLCVHRKGATRAFAAGHPELARRHAGVGQPVIVPGDMGSASYVMAGTPQAMAETWGSVCHGAGRVKSRTSAKKEFNAATVLEELAAHGVTVRAGSKKSLLEEAPGAYKNVDHVVNTCVNAGLATIVARLRPIVVIKG
ncbi:MAG TPA: RtcB family protein [bacterium]|nr:RtcB family protein [bacterium]